MRSVRTPAELLADAAELATAGRTARWLDQLTADGHITAGQRVALAAEDGSTTLTSLLRRAELAGHNPYQVLLDAITSRPLDDARQLTNVVNHRITTAVALDPVGVTYADWIPQVDDPAWHTYLTELAEAADDRRAELGHAVVTNPPQWAVEALGPVPAGFAARDRWQNRAGAVAAHRELTGHTDETTALGPAPKPGRVEEYASWRAAWRALGRPDADRAEAEMSDGQLRVRIRANDREQTWAPRYVANDLAGTRQSAAQHRATAALRTAEAETADPADRARLGCEAADATALADLLDTQAAALDEADTARADWYAHTAETRAAADRACAELAARGASSTPADDLTTAEDWLAAQAEAQHAEDRDRHITDEADLTEVAEQRTTDTRTAEPTPHIDAADTSLPDIRETLTTDLSTAPEDDVRIPSAAETADTIAKAQRALAEIEQRRVQDERAAAEEARAEQLTRWHTANRAADVELDRTAATVDLAFPQ
jgi:hypothetical protein